MIRVLHYIRNLGLGGTEKTCQLFFNNAGSDFDAMLVHERSGQKDRLPLCKGRVVEIDSYKANDKPNPSELQSVIDSFKPDILHVYRSGYAEFPTDSIIWHSGKPEVIETNVFGFLDSSPCIDKTLFMSEWLMGHAIKQYRIPPGHPIMKRLDFVNNPVEEPASLQHHPFKNMLPDDAIILGRCGRPDNGIYNSINVEAARMLREEGYNIHFLVMAPPSNMIDDLRRYSIPMYIVEPTVDPVAISTFYNTVDIYAHARADGETFGVNIAEAMMHGKPVVTHIATPSVPGMGVFQSQTELVEDCKTGFIVQNNPVDYATALRDLINSPKTREHFGYAGAFKAMNEYRASICQDKLESIYRGVVHG